MAKSFAYRVSAWNRQRKWRLLSREFSFTSDWQVLDVGFSDTEYSETDNFLEKHYPYLNKVTALGVDHAVDFTKRYPEVRAVTYDGNVFPFADKQFDLVWSNAVIEHVGDRAKQLNFIKEMMRVGKRVFFTTPNKYFPVEIHTRVPLLHLFLPKKYFDKFLKLIGKPWAAGDYMCLLSVREVKRLLKEAGADDYRIYRNRFFGFTLDFVVVINSGVNA